MNDNNTQPTGRTEDLPSPPPPPPPPPLRHVKEGEIIKPDPPKIEKK